MKVLVVLFILYSCTTASDKFIDETQELGDNQWFDEDGNMWYEVMDLSELNDEQNLMLQNEDGTMNFFETEDAYRTRSRGDNHRGVDGIFGGSNGDKRERERERREQERREHEQREHNRREHERAEHERREHRTMDHDHGKRDGIMHRGDDRRDHHDKRDGIMHHAAVDTMDYSKWDPLGLFHLVNDDRGHMIDRDHHHDGRDHHDKREHRDEHHHIINRDLDLEEFESHRDHHDGREHHDHDRREHYDHDRREHHDNHEHHDERHHIINRDLDLEEFENHRDHHDGREHHDHDRHEHHDNREHHDDHHIINRDLDLEEFENDHKHHDGREHHDERDHHDRRDHHDGREHHDGRDHHDERHRITNRNFDLEGFENGDLLRALEEFETPAHYPEEDDANLHDGWEKTKHKIKHFFKGHNDNTACSHDSECKSGDNCDNGTCQPATDEPSHKHSDDSAEANFWDLRHWFHRDHHDHHEHDHDHHHDHKPRNPHNVADDGTGDQPAPTDNDQEHYAIGKTILYLVDGNEQQPKQLWKYNWNAEDYRVGNHGRDRKRDHSRRGGKDKRGRDNHHHHKRDNRRGDRDMRGKWVETWYVVHDDSQLVTYVDTENKPMSWFKFFFLSSGMFAVIYMCINYYSKAGYKSINEASESANLLQKDTYQSTEETPCAA